MIEQGRGQKPSADLPFSAIVGQAELKRALLAVAADDSLDGLLICGEKGTAKSTTVRALADLLPEQRAVADCPYGCSSDDPRAQCERCRARTDPPVETRPVPLVTLPLGATRERVVGTLSVADALDGDHEFEPGLLARANRGFLYVDEVNLLDDHLVDVVLDAAASGVNRVERDAVSATHPAAVTLVGTMNPEEGDLRPQLRDRFALQATVTACEDVDDRVTIVERALGNGERATLDNDAAVRERLSRAREQVADVALPRERIAEIAELCRDAGVDGHRGDIATARAARAFAALDGRDIVSGDDVRVAAELALPHRLQSDPFENAPEAGDVVDDHLGGAENEEPTEAGDNSAGDSGSSPAPETEGGTDSGTENDSDGARQPSPADDGSGHEGEGQQSTAADGGSGHEGEGQQSTAADDGSGHGGEGQQSTAADDESGHEEGDEEAEGTPLVPGQSRDGTPDVGRRAAPDLSPSVDRDGGGGGGDARGSRVQDEPGAGQRGPRVRSQRAEGSSVDAAASVRAAARRGSAAVESRDLRESVRAGESAALVVFVVDASASMRAAMRAAKGTVLELLEDAYQERDEVAFVAFAGEGAEVLLPPTDSVTLAARHLKTLPTGDRTPLPAGLDAASEVLDRADPAAGVVVLVTDGRTNTAQNPVADTRTAARALAARNPHVLVVDAGDGGRAALTDLVVTETDADRVALDALSADRVDAATGCARENQL